MARGVRKSKIVAPRPLYAPAVRRETGWIESDRYDRRAWSDLANASAGIKELVEAGARLVPHFDSLLQDIFLALFKYNLVWLTADEVRRSAILNRTILERLIPTPAFAALKERTLLEEDKAAIAAMVLAEHALAILRAETGPLFGVNRLE